MTISVLFKKTYNLVYIYYHTYPEHLAIHIYIYIYIYILALLEINAVLYCNFLYPIICSIN